MAVPSSFTQAVMPAKRTTDASLSAMPRTGRWRAECSACKRYALIFEPATANAGRVRPARIMGGCARRNGIGSLRIASQNRKTMNTISASAAGQFQIGEMSINRMGYGAMRITGSGVWGPPSDRHAALATLRRLPEIGVTFIDTADSYGPDVSERLIREALHPYRGLLIATKAGLTRPGPDQWVSNGRPAYLIAQARSEERRVG